MNAPTKGTLPHATTMTSREFNHKLGKAKTASSAGPVIITDRGHPAHVLMTYETYSRLIGTPRTLYESLADTRPEADFDFEFERAPGKARPVDFGFDD